MKLVLSLPINRNLSDMSLYEPSCDVRCKSQDIWLPKLLNERALISTDPPVKRMWASMTSLSRPATDEQTRLKYDLWPRKTCLGISAYYQRIRHAFRWPTRLPPAPSGCFLGFCCDSVSGLLLNPLKCHSVNDVRIQTRNQTSVGWRDLDRMIDSYLVLQQLLRPHEKSGVAVME